MNILALDVGGTAIKYAYFNDDTLIFQKECPSNAKAGGPQLLETMKHLISSSLKDYPVDYIGISTTGQVDPFQGSITYANENVPNYTGMQIKEILESTFGITVFVENDVNAAAIGEAIYGSGKEKKDFLMITYGTGIGGAIFINNQLYSGAHHAAAELGHMITHPNGLLCNCGTYGCYEMYGSTSALVKKAYSINKNFIDGRKIFEALSQQDTQAIELVDEWITEISYGLINLINIFDPSYIILGGGIMAQPYLLTKLNTILQNQVTQVFQNVTLLPAKLQNLAGVYGMKAICSGLYKYPTEMFCYNNLSI